MILHATADKITFMPFSSPRHDTGRLESNAHVSAVTPPLREQHMFGQNAAETMADGPRIDELRMAIKANRVNFPVPVPVFPAQFRPEIQWRLVELYFIRGWSSRQLAERYGVTARRIQQSIQHWVDLAVSRGYLQVIPPESPVMPLPMPAWMSAVTPDGAAVAPQFTPLPPVGVPEYATMPSA